MAPADHMQPDSINLKEDLAPSQRMIDVHLSTDQIARLIADFESQANPPDKLTQLEELIDAHSRLAPEEPKLAQQIRQIFVRSLGKSPDILLNKKFSDFLAEQILEEDFAQLSWDASQQVIAFWENLYSFRDHREASAEHLREQGALLLKMALQHFERRNAFEKMFQLLRLAPISSAWSDPELLRLRNRAYLHEMRRVQRHRRWLYAYLLFQILLIIGVFPWLFINAENGRIQREIEQVAEVDLPEEIDHQYLSYSDGLYWSLITAGSIGYGDITPQTRMGKIIASMLGVMGVITIGVIAGLILQWITPRRLN
jgi:hypothetical protein